MKSKKRLLLALVYILLIVLAAIWVFPIIWIVLTSFRGEGGRFVSYIIPKKFTLDGFYLR